MNATVDPTSVACPDCQAPEGARCRVSEGWPDGTAHAARHDSARLHAVEHGICALCSKPIVRGVREEDGPVEVWHPDPDQSSCPPLPDPQADWNAYATAINLGLRPGFPGPEHFRPLCTHVPPQEDWDPDVGAWECRDCDPPQTTYRTEPTAGWTAPSEAITAMGFEIDLARETGAPPPGLDPTLGDLAALCPECTAGKPLNCAGQALVGDDLVPCATTQAL